MNGFFYNNSDYFVDEATGECYFESDEFKRLLKRVKEENDNDHKIRGEWPVERGVYSTKEKTISHINLDELDFSSRVIDSFDGNADFIGYPTKEGEGVDALFDTLSKSEQRSETCYALYSIICEESEAYFLGQKDLDEVCRIIQSRATLMMSERMIGNE